MLARRLLPNVPRDVDKFQAVCDAIPEEAAANRELPTKKWGDEGYAWEELVAELGSVFLAADLGLAIEPREDHAAYIASWLKC